MFKKTIIIILFLLFSIVFSSCSKQEVIEINKNQSIQKEGIQVDNEKSSESQTEELVEEKQISLRNLLMESDSYKCHWSIEKADQNNDADAENINEEAGSGIEKGEIYIKEGNFYQEVKIQQNSQKITVNIIKNENGVYQWNSMMNQGTKMSLEKAQSMEVIDLEKTLDFNCEKIEIEDEIFNSPQDIKFIQF
jgi:hypothetical protein